MVDRMSNDDRIEVLANGGGTQLAPSAGDPFDEDDPGPWPIHGVAMTPGLATGGSLIPTMWTPDVLEDATPKLAGKDIVTDRKHDPEENPGVREVIGEVTATEYLSDHGIGYNGEVDDREIAQKIARGRLDASPYLYRTLSDETRDVDGTEATVADEVLGFDNLAVVRNGAGGDDVAIQTGPHPDLGSEAAEALAEAFPDEQPSDEPAEPGTGPSTIDTNMSNNDPDDPDPTVESLSEEVETLRRENKRLRAENSPIKGTLAETLAADSPFTADELADRFSFDELRERVEDDDVVETLTPAPRTRDPDPTGQTKGERGAETLSADDEAELETLRQRREVLADFATEARLDELDEQIETLAPSE